MGELPPLHMVWDFPSPFLAGVVEDMDDEVGERGRGGTGGRRNTKRTRVVEAAPKEEAAGKVDDFANLV